MVRKYLVSFLLIFFLVGCADDGANNSEPLNIVDQSPHVTMSVILIGSVWRLEELEGEAVDSSNLLHIPYILLKEDRSVRGSGGCNDFRGSYTLRGQQLQIVRSHDVRFACLSGLAKENRFFSVLDSTKTFEKAGEKLKLLDENGTVRAVFAAGI